MVINLFTLSAFAITTTCLWLVGLLLIYSRSKVHKVWMLFNLSIAFWAAGLILVGNAKDSQSALWYWQIAHASGIFVAIFFYHVVYIYCNLRCKRFLMIAYIYGLIYEFLNLSNANNLYLGTEFIFNSIHYLQGRILFFAITKFFWFFFVFLAFYELFKYNRRNSGEDRRRTFYFLIASIIGFAGGATIFLPMFGINIYPLAILTIPLYCILTTYAILKHQLMDIRVAIQKSFVYSVLVAFITATYFVFVFLSEKLFQGLIGYTSLIVSIAYAFFIALFFNPVKNKIQHFADRVFLRKDPVQIAQENELLRQELLHSEKLKTVATFASGMAHEIKNPLTAIKTFAEYLPQKTEDKEFLGKFSEIVGSEVEKIDNLVHQLLDFSKPAPLQLKKADINKLVDETLELLNNQFIRHNIKVNKNYSDFEMIAMIDQNQMKQVFLNLFLNAIEAMPNGGTLTVSTNLCSSSGKESVTICVQDTGCGILDKDLPHIFEPFYSTKEKGSGLGLSIVYNIIKEHRGKAKVKSYINEGTRFIIELANSNT